MDLNHNNLGLSAVIKAQRLPLLQIINLKTLFLGDLQIFLGQRMSQKLIKNKVIIKVSCLKLIPTLNQLKNLRIEKKKMMK